MEKLSQDKVASVLAQVPAVLRALSEENGTLKEKVAHYERRDRATKLASEMTRKNLDPETTETEKVAMLMRPDTDIEVIERAVGMSAPQMKLASLTDDTGNPSSAEGSFESGIVAIGSR